MSPSRASKSEHQKHFFLLFAVSLRSTLKQYFCRFSHDFKRLSSAFLTFHFFFPFYFIYSAAAWTTTKTNRKKLLALSSQSLSHSHRHSRSSLSRFIAINSTRLHLTLELCALRGPQQHIP